MGQNREPGNKAKHQRSINRQQRKQENTTEKRQSLQQVMLGKLNSHMSVNEARTLSHTIHKTPRREYRQNIL